MNTKFLPLGALCVIALVACAAPTPTVTPAPPTPTPTLPVPLATRVQDIIGTWAGLSSDALFQQFNTDGTCQVAIFEQDLANQPDFICAFRFEGTQLIMTHEGKPKGLPSCPNRTCIYQVQLLGGDKINFVKVDDVCRGRVNSTAQEHQRVR